MNDNSEYSPGQRRKTYDVKIGYRRVFALKPATSMAALSHHHWPSTIEDFTMTESLERIASALQHIPSDDRDIWVKVGMAIHSELGDMGLDVFDIWSQSADSYRIASVRATWKSLKLGGGITIATLFKLAHDHGWRDTNRDWPQQSAADIEAFHRKQAEMAEQGRAAIEEEQATAAALADRLLAAAAPASATHPYLLRKEVKPDDNLKEVSTSEAESILNYTPRSGDKALQGTLLIAPIRRFNAGASVTTSSVELIDEHGYKTALKGKGTKAGGFAVLGFADGLQLENIAELVICEGIATGLSIKQATNLPVFCALSCTNVKAVAQAVREEYPHCKIVIAADLDKAGQPDRHSKDAARAVNGLLAAPVFSGTRAL